MQRELSVKIADGQMKKTPGAQVKSTNPSQLSCRPAQLQQQGGPQTPLDEKYGESSWT
jgi:hypothetical protein